MITLPFRCTYKDGEVQKFERESNDVVGSLNIKRALAAMFQLKLDSLGQSSFTALEVNNVFVVAWVYNNLIFLYNITDWGVWEMRCPVSSN